MKYSIEQLIICINWLLIIWFCLFRSVKDSVSYLAISCCIAKKRVWLEDVNKTNPISPLHLHQMFTLFRQAKCSSGCYFLPGSRKLGGQWPCDYTKYGSKNPIYYLIWYNLRFTVRQVFVSQLYTCQAENYTWPVLKKVSIWIKTTSSYRLYLNSLSWGTLKRRGGHVPQIGTRQLSLVRLQGRSDIIVWWEWL